MTTNEITLFILLSVFIAGFGVALIQRNRAWQRNETLRWLITPASYLLILVSRWPADSQEAQWARAQATAVTNFLHEEQARRGEL